MEPRVAAAPGPPREPPRPAEVRVVLHGVSWEAYEQLVECDTGARLTYREGVLEIMSPSGEHETDKTMLGRLLEAYAEEMDIELNGFGNMTFRSRAKERGLEPDECYLLRPIETREPARPDLAIEVVHTRWSIDKLDVYRGLEVPEVWIWRGGEIEVQVLAVDTYERRGRSALLPALDLVLLASFVGRRDQVRAVREYRKALRGGG